MRERDYGNTSNTNSIVEFGVSQVPGFREYNQPLFCYGVVIRGGGNVKAIASFHGKNEIAARRAANKIGGDGADVEWIDPGTNYITDGGKLKTHGKGNSAHFAYKADGANCG